MTCSEVLILDSETRGPSVRFTGRGLHGPYTLSSIGRRDISLDLATSALTSVEHYDMTSYKPEGIAVDILGL